VDFSIRVHAYGFVRTIWDRFAVRATVAPHRLAFGRKQVARDAERLLEMEQNINPDRLFGHGGHFAYVILDGRAEKSFLFFVGEVSIVKRVLESV